MTPDNVPAKGVTMHSHYQGSLWQRGLVGVLGFLLVLAIWAFAAINATAQEAGDESVRQGEAVFKQSCAVCHTVGRGVLVGPDLQGVTERRDESWLKVQIKSPSIHREQKDPTAMANLAKFGVPMPELGLTDQQVAAVIAYLKAGTTAQAAATTPAQYAPTLVLGVLAIVAFTLVGLIAGTKRVEVKP